MDRKSFVIGESGSRLSISEGQISIDYGMISQSASTSYDMMRPSLTSSQHVEGEDEMGITYPTLIEQMRLDVMETRGKSAPQIFANLKSALSGFLTYLGKCSNLTVGRELTHDFAKNSHAYVSAVFPENNKRAADVLHLLRQWEKLAKSSFRSDQSDAVCGASKFHAKLRVEIAKSGKSTNQIATAINTAPKVINSWISGAMPVKRGLPVLRRLEAHLGLARGELESLLPPLRKSHYHGRPVHDTYSRRHAENVKLHYFISRQQFEVELGDQWHRYLTFKTVVSTTVLLRSKKGVWRVIPVADANPEQVADPLISPYEGGVCPSAGRVLESFRGYFGFLRLPHSPDPKISGMGLPESQSLTFGLLAVPEYVEAYLQFMKARAGGALNGGHRAFAGFVSSMVRNETGYLYQQPEFGFQITECAKGRSWSEMCSKTKKLCDDWQAASTNKHSRDGKSAIAPLLKLSNPLEPIRRAIQDLDVAAAGCSPGSTYRAVYKRDALLLAMAIANPLRLRTFTIMKYVPPGEDSDYPTNLYALENGRWRLRFEPNEFKNGGHKNTIYDAPLPEALGARIEEYVNEHRPILVRKNPKEPWLFPSWQGKKHGRLSSTINKIAAQYIPEVPRLGMHALRHLVASHFLSENPNQYARVAELLHDTLETVLKHYAHGQTETSFQAHEAHLEKFFL